MNGFELQFWHVAAFFAVIALNIVKKDIAGIIHGFLFMLDHRFIEGQRIQIQSNSGTWEDVFFVRYCPPLPFGKVPGGLLVRHEQGKGKVFLEKITFASFRGLRMRKPEAGH
ncbi:MAG: hypothetical protein GY795_50865 [Desulfobacterales bacterium]|nr:hypothetical protein [Desulfobacterales bacterium]